jgi:HSP20 family protein
MGRWMDSVAGHLHEGAGAWSPSADVTETEDGYLVEANLADGVLTVRVPKSETVKPRRIAITGK